MYSYIMFELVEVIIVQPLENDTRIDHFKRIIS